MRSRNPRITTPVVTGAGSLSRRDFLQRVGGAAAAATVGGLGLLESAPAYAAVHRPLSDFLGTQLFCGVGCVHWTSPAANKAMYVDLWGTHLDYLASLGINPGTSISGMVTERPLKDGRAEVTVLVHANNAIAWATEGFNGFPLGDDEPLIFGYLPAEIAASPGTSPALANGQSEFIFTIEAPGAPIPDTTTAFFFDPASYPWFELRKATLRATAFGDLRAAFGVPEGTSGRATIVQVGLIETAIRQGFKGGLADAFPGELIHVQAIGR